MSAYDDPDQRESELPDIIYAPSELAVSAEAGEPQEAAEPHEAAAAPVFVAQPRGGEMVAGGEEADAVDDDVDESVASELPHTSAKEFRDEMNRQLDEDEAEASERRRKIDEAAGDTPVLSQLARANAWLDEKETEIEDGAVRGAVDMGTGLVDMATKPPPGPEDVEKLVEDDGPPVDLQHAAGQDSDVTMGVLKQTGVGKAIQEGKYGDALGQAGIQIASFFVGGELGEAEELAETPEIVPDTVPDVVPDTVPDVAPDTVPDVAPDTVPDAPATQRSPIGPPAPPAPTPDVPVVDPPPYTPDSLPPTVPTRIAPGGPPPAPTPDVVPDTVPDTAPPTQRPPSVAPNTLHSEFDATYVPKPGEPITYPPHGGAAGPWTNDPVPAMVDRYHGEGGRYLSPEGTPLPQRALAPVYDPDAAQLMGKPADYDVGPKEYGVYRVKPGTTALQSPVAPAYGKPGGATPQIFTGTDPETGTGPGLRDLNGKPIVRADGTTVEPVDGKPVPAVDRTGGPYSYQYGHTWKVDELSPEELEEIEAAERGR